MVQVADGFYKFDNYVELHRWTSYWYQLKAVADSQAKSVLEIGYGSGVTTDCMRKMLGLEVTTFDFDASLKPDVVGDVRRIGEKFSPQSFDCVCAFQVLEHLPYEDFEPTLRQIATLARRAVLISLPHWGYFLQCRLTLIKPRWTAAIARKITRPHKWRFDGLHHWEIGTSEYPLERVRASIAKVFQIKREYYCPDYAYHYYFECAPAQRAQPTDELSRRAVVRNP